MKLDKIVHIFSNYCLELIKSRQFLEFVSFQFITITWDILDQYSIVDCDPVVRSTTSTGMGLLLVIVFYI